LIVLLTLSSIFLCGIVVTYIANADNYKQQYEGLKADRDSLSKKADNLTKQVNETLEQKNQAEKRFNSEITALKTEKSEMQTKLDNAEREKAELLQKLTSYASITEGFYQTNDKQGQLLKNTLDELNKLQAKEVVQRKELNETNAALVEKMAIIETLEAENKRLIEEKAALQGKFDQSLRPMGTATPRTETARPATTEAGEETLHGLITAVDLKNSMATISIGTADGVKEGMRFHATRGNEFICDILIIDVDIDQAVGVLELVQRQPNVGDNVSTGL
jgi:myosin heavy subunit